MNTKQQLNIKQIKTVNEIVYEELVFLKYSTQVRNIAYLKQLQELLHSIYQSYTIDRGLGRIFLYNVLRINSDILESLLYCALETKGISIRPSRTGAKATKLVRVSKRNGLISKNLAAKAQRLIDFRNNLHPYKQNELHLKISDDILLNSSSIVNEISKELKEHFETNSGKKGATESNIEIDNESCNYCLSGMTEGGEICAVCGNIFIG